MSKITNDSLTWSGTECFIAVCCTLMATVGVKGLKNGLRHSLLSNSRNNVFNTDLCFYYWYELLLIAPIYSWKRSYRRLLFSGQQNKNNRIIDIFTSWLIKQRWTFDKIEVGY